MSINFLGLNSGFDSGALVQQLVQVEVQNRIRPLETKQRNLEAEKDFISEISTEVAELRTAMGIDDLLDGTTTLLPRGVSSTDTDEEFLSVEADGSAAPQTFDLEINQLASNTKRTSTADVVAGITTATILDDVATKGAVTISTGTVTINGETQTFSLDTSTDDVADLVTFLDSFTGVSASYNANGHIDLTGVTSIGGAGDTSNLMSALGFNNAEISGGAVSSLQNLDALRPSDTLDTAGINGTTITINGEDITFDPSTTTINNLITTINSTPDTKVTASYDSLNGKFVLTNDDTGAISLTLSSSDSNIITQLNLSAGEVLGNNAEFTISTINGGTTLVSNDNEVTGIIDGVTLNLNKITSSAETISITRDKDAYRERIETILTSTSDLIKNLEAEGTSFATGFAQAIKNVITSYFSSATDTFKSGVEIGITSSLDADNNFSSYTIDQDTLEAAMDDDITAVHAVLFGSSGSSISPLSDGSDGIFVALQSLLDAYRDPDVPGEGILGDKSESVDTLIDNVEDDIESAQDSIDAFQARLQAQFSQLDVLTAELQNQQSALSGFLS